MSLHTRTVELVDAHVLDLFIEENLGRPWSLQQNGEFSNDSLAYFEVYPDPDATALVQEWLDSPLVKGHGRLNQPGYAESVTITDQILCELCNRGLLEEGDLTVHVYW